MRGRAVVLALVFLLSTTVPVAFNTLDEPTVSLSPSNPTGVDVRVVGELVARDTVTNGIHVLVGGLKLVVDCDALLGKAYEPFNQPHVLDVRDSADGEHDSVYDYLGLLAVLSVRHLDLIYDLLEGLDFSLEQEVHPVGLHLLLEVHNAVRVFSW